MLDDDAGRGRELPDALERRIAVGNVVVRQGLTLQLLRRGKRASWCLLVDVKGRILVRVLTVAHSLHQLARIQSTVTQRIIAERV